METIMKHIYVSNTIWCFIISSSKVTVIITHIGQIVSVFQFLCNNLGALKILQTHKGAVGWKRLNTSVLPRL